MKEGGRVDEWENGRRHAPRLFPFLLCALCLLPLAFAARGGEQKKEQPPIPAVTGEWKQALPPYEFQFPRAHASHPDYKLEWWYYTGNLTAEDGRRFGYQLTFFRLGVEWQPQHPSRWAVRDLFAAHLAVTEIDGQQFHFADKLNRAGIGWAGAQTEAYHI
jgi:predicted secreted hydrolase